MNPYFFWVLIICVLAVLAIPFLILFIIGVRKRSRILKWIGGVPVTGFLVLVVLLFGSFVISIVHPYSDTTNGQTIRQSFVSNFDLQPGSDFVPLHQRIFGVADTGCMYIQFKASPVTFERIRAKKFETIQQSEFFSHTGGPNAPPWWVQTNQAGGIYYKNADWKGPFYGNEAHIFYQPESNLVYFCTEGSD
jgi:hypothetical protein